MDTDGSGGISFDEFVAMMQLGEVETDFTKEINEAFKFFDKDGDGEVKNGKRLRHTKTKTKSAMKAFAFEDNVNVSAV